MITRINEEIAEEFETIDSEIEDELSSGQIKYEISTYPADFTLEVLRTKWRKGDIIIPDFQRKYVWNVYQASRLIESFMLGLPIPPAFLYIDRSAKSLVIDGQQRLKSIFWFYGEPGKEKLNPKEEKLINFKLKGLSESSPWYNKSYEDFSEEDKTKFDDCVLRATIVKQINPDDNTSIFHIFERLNTGGTLLTNQEVRNCVYAGSFNNCLLELNKYPNWRKVFTNESEHIRQMDVELILRFFALRNDLDNYVKPIKDFISIYMAKKEIRFMDENKMDEYKEVFIKTVDAIINNIGPKPFHIRNGLNNAVCDSVMVAFSNNLDKIPKDVKNRYEKLCGDDLYLGWVSKSTNDVLPVKSRIQRATEILFD